MKLPFGLLSDRNSPPQQHEAQQQRYIHTLTYQYLSSLSDNQDDDDDDGQDGLPGGQPPPLDDDFFNFLANKATKVTDAASGEAANSEGRRRRRDRMKQFLSNRLGSIVSGSSGSSSGGDMVEPIRIDGQEGMPGLDDILSEPSAASDAAGSSRGSSTTIGTGGTTGGAADGSDHASDLSRIDAAVFQFKTEVRDRLSEQRQTDPNSVPVNAEEFLDRVIEEVREYNLAEAREKRAQDEIRSYEAAQRQRLEEETRGKTASEDPLVMGILSEAKGNADAIKAEKAEEQSFREYERALREKVEAADVGVASDGEDIDEKALKIMQNLYDKRSEEPTEWDEDFPEWDTDNLEDGINEIKSAIEEKAKDAAGKKVNPEDMKEWVMYRSIATRMAAEAGQEEVDEGDIKSQLESWKEFQVREEAMRRDAGLTKGARMPFPWVDRLGQNDDEDDEAAAAKKKPVDRRHPDDIRYEYDKQALEVLTDLMSKTADPTRQQKLRGEIEGLKVEIHELEKKIFERGPWTPPVEEPVEEELKGPVDISDIFGDSPYIEGDQPSPSTYAAAPEENALSQDFDPAPPDSPFFSDSFEEDMAVDEELPATPPPDTPFFSNSFEEEDIDDVPDATSTSAASSSTGDYDFSVPDEVEGSEEVKSLGSLDEQKFRSMTRRAGVRSQAGEDELKKQWEAYLNAEQAMRDKTGLSGGDDPALLKSKVEYNVDDVIKDGGDVDAEAILASIGKRPGRKGKDAVDGDASSAGDGAPPSYTDTFSSPRSENADDEYQQFLRYEQERAEQARLAQGNAAASAMGEAGDSISPSEEGTDTSSDDEDVIVYHKHSTTWDKTSISDQLYRSLSPEGSLKDDPEAKEKDKTAFEEYLKKEQEMRNRVESMDVPQADVLGTVSFSDDDQGTEASEEFLDLDKVDDYVDSALDSIGPRPEVRKRKRTVDPDYARDYGDMRSGGFGDDDVEDDNVPEWVKIGRRQEAERKQAAFDSTRAEDEEGGASLKDYDYEEKERQAAEFERETSTSTDIDIGEVLGRDYFGPGDEPDDFYSLDKGRGSSFSSFQKRKKTLLEYTELTVTELNSLIEYKESETATGASRYLKKVRRPYREFGAIFRLEGLLVDITGLQWEAWKETAKKHELEMPSLEEVRTASAHRAPYAIQRIFYWTDDVVEVRDIAKSHSDALNEVFAQWMEEQGVTYTPPQGPKSFDLFGVEEDESMPETAAGSLSVSTSAPTSEVPSGEGDESDDTTSIPQPSESDYIGMQFRSWKKASEACGYSEPSVDEMQIAMFTGPEEAVEKVFGWTTDSDTIPNVVSIYRDAFRQETDLWARQHQPEVISKLKKEKSTATTPAEETPREAEDSSTNALSRDDVAEMQLFAWSTAADRHGFEVPSLEDIQLASWVSPDEAVQRVYKWTDDALAVQSIASTYREAMKKITDIYIKKKNIQVAAAAKESSAPHDAAAKAPTQDDVMKIQLEAWAQTAKQYGHDAPTMDEIELAAFSGPDEAVRRVFKWTDDAEKSSEIIAAHKSILQSLSQEFLRRFGQGTGSATVTASSSAAATDREDEDLPLFQLEDGGVDWIKALLDVEMPCAVVSHLDQEQLDVILETTGLDTIFPPDKRVSATNFYASQSQEFLGAALRLERRPDYCAVFDTTPSSAAAAHQVDMQSICRIGSYKNYDLLGADLTFKYFTQLQTQVLRGLFTDNKLDEPQTEIQDIKPETRPSTTMTRFFEEGDR